MTQTDLYALGPSGMSLEPSPITTQVDDPRVLEALEEYVAAVEAGHAPDRQAFLARHAAIAEVLAECLEGLEALHDASSSRYPAPVPQSVPSPGAEEFHGSPLGDFRILREIGRGGMGVVYEAEQLSLGRRVALKVLPFAAALDARQLQRFKNEAQAAAHLHHPHIVPVYGVGVERGVHYYAMQLIDGQNLGTLVTELRDSGSADFRTPGRGSESSPLAGLPELTSSDTRTALGTLLSAQRSSRSREFYRTIARFVAQAALALEHAHGVGIVHRDVKPANLLIDGHGNIWITDFGLAQFHADAGLTQTGDLLGTLRYMSPEQASGQRSLIDHRTDVYSLGATLHELLTLRPIFDATERQGLLYQILHEQPKPLRAVDRAVPVELEVIVQKAVAKTPADRYATAQEFAEDLKRFLDYRPILARRPTVVQQIRQWLRRHPSVAAAGLLFIVMLAVASLVSAWLIRIEQAKTQQAYEAERHRAEEAEKQYLLARRSVDDLIEIAEQQLADNPQFHGVRKLMLEAALAYYGEFIEQRSNDPAAAVQLEATRARVKQILADLAVLQGAGRLGLLKEAIVLDDLRISAAQRGQLEEVARNMDEQRRKTFEGFHRIPEEERRKRFLESASAHEAAVAQVLGREPLGRLKQIELQRKGPAAFREADVVAVLKLTAEQRDRIRALEPEGFFGGWDGSRGGPGRKPLSPPRPAESREQLLKSAMEKIEALLTADQLRRWHRMIGAPFAGAFTPPPPWRPGSRDR